MTKEQYIKQHPRTILSKKLKRNRWKNNTKIVVVSGIISAHEKSHLQQALVKSKLHKYCVGGRAGTFSNDGYFMAVA